MSKRDDLIVKYTAQLKDAGVKVDAALLEKVTIGCGPSIYNRDAATVAGSDPAELATVKNNYLIKKLGMKDSAKLDEGISKVMGQLKGVKNKYRAVVYYMLCQEFGKASAYKK